MYANTPKPPYYAVIFSSIQNNDSTGYQETAERMLESGCRNQDTGCRICYR